ncbi:MAG TPA: TAXI family TRAP transporter solute-binding subunit, partial [Geminicoccaceae bacterium]|nr:TAXI family TRAP transporter solute-binding subunit [Geminicoccaceae bacterium]
MTTYTWFAKLGVAAVAAGLVGGAPLGGASAQEVDRTGWPQSLKIGTASQGGTYFIYGAGWAGLVQEMLGVATSTEVTGGPVQNFALVQSGDLDL